MNLSAIAELITAIAAIGALVSSLFLHGRVQSVHLQMNSRLDQLIGTVKQVERAAGILEGKRQQLAENALRRGDGPN